MENYGLSTAGKKEQLLTRLVEHLNSIADPIVEEPVEDPTVLSIEDKKRLRAERFNIPVAPVKRKLGPLDVAVDPETLRKRQERFGEVTVEPKLSKKQDAVQKLGAFNVRVSRFYLGRSRYCSQTPAKVRKC